MRGSKDVGLFAAGVVAVNRRRHVEGLEYIKALGLLCAPNQARAGADAGIVELANDLSVKRVDGGLRLHVVQARNKKFASHDVEGLDDILSFGHNRFPLLGSGAGCGQHDASIGSVIVSGEIERVSNVDG